MTTTADFPSVFKRLRSILESHAPQLIVKTDNEDTYYLDTARIQKNKTPLFFGAVQIKKSYVSYHLFPIYMYPELMAELSPELRKHMQGKSCFNFKRTEEPLFDELSRLTQAGMTKFEAEGLLP